MALRPSFPEDPHAILDPGIRWFPADEALRERRADQLLPPLVAMLRKEVKAWRDRGYEGAAETSKSLLHWWFVEQHMTPSTYAGVSWRNSAISSPSARRWKRSST